MASEALLAQLGAPTLVGALAAVLAILCAVGAALCFTTVRTGGGRILTAGWLLGDALGLVSWSTGEWLPPTLAIAAFPLTLAVAACVAVSRARTDRSEGRGAGERFSPRGS